jgi:hypothetical protein
VNELDRLTVQTVVLRRLQERLSQAYKEAKTRLEEALGAEGRRAARVGNYRLATATVTKMRASVFEPALMRWVEDNYPDAIVEEVVTTRKINSKFVEAVKRATEDAGQPCGPGGELDILGVSLLPGYLTVRPAADCDAIIDELWRTGQVGLDMNTDVMLEIPE